MHAKTIAYQFGLTSYVLERNVAGVTHEESLISPKPAGSCLNWVVGHLTSTRNQSLRLFGEKPIYEQEEFAAYLGEVDVPLTRENAIPFDELKRRFKALQEPLVNCLHAMTDADMEKLAPLSPTGNPNETMGSLIASLAFHEAYHAGQTGILRRVIGREGVIKPPKVTASR